MTRSNYILLSLVFLLLLLTATACGSSKEGVSSPSDSPQMSETEQSQPSSFASAEPSTEPETEQGSASPSPSVSAEASHEHESAKPSAKPTTKPSDDKPSATPSIQPASESASKEPEPSASESSAKPSAKPSEESEDHSETVIVEIKDFAFSPSELTITKGSTVKFINRDTVKHTATADGGEFDTGLLGKDESKEVKFDSAGTISYYCAPHPDMTGTIIVKD